MMKPVTFSSLESTSDKELVEQPTDLPLERWYQRIRNTPLGDFAPGDLAIACRQGLFLDAIVPIALHCLRRDPLAGEMYDGEVIAALAQIGKEYWRIHPGQAAQLASIAHSVFEHADEGLRSDIERLLALPTELS